LRRSTGLEVDLTDKALREQGFRLCRRRSGTSDWGTPIHECAALSGTGLKLTWLAGGVSADVRWRSTE